MPDVCRIEFGSSVGTLGKDPEEFQVRSSVFLQITILIGIQRVTVFSPDGAYLAVAGGKEVCFPLTVLSLFYNMRPFSCPS